MVEMQPGGGGAKQAPAGGKKKAGRKRVVTSPTDLGPHPGVIKTPNWPCPVRSPPPELGPSWGSKVSWAGDPCPPTGHCSSSVLLTGLVLSLSSFTNPFDSLSAGGILPKCGEIFTSPWKPSQYVLEPPRVSDQDHLVSLARALWGSLVIYLPPGFPSFPQTPMGAATERGILPVFERLAVRDSTGHVDLCHWLRQFPT